MNVSQALEARKSTRAFLDKPVPQALITRILHMARHAPSGTNTQPWQVCVVSGDKKAQLDAKLKSAYAASTTDPDNTMDYTYYPQEWREPYKSRRRATGLQMYATLNIQRQDKDQQYAQWLKNYEAFGAPVVLFFFLDKIMQTGSFLDYGMFLQSIMLMAVEEGLASCPQAALAQFAPLIKEELGYNQDCYLLCGMALGYEDKNAVVNSYRTPRIAVEEFTKFV